MTVYFSTQFEDTDDIDWLQIEDDGLLISLDITDYITVGDEFDYLTDTSALEIVPSELVIYLGENKQLTLLTIDRAGVVYYDATDSTDWSVDDDLIGEFDSNTKGLFITKKTGTCIVTASYYGILTKTLSVTIHNPLIVAHSSDMVGRYQPTVTSYLDLLTSQYQNSTKAKRTLETFLDIVEDIRELAQSLIYYFSFFKIISYNTTGSSVNTLTVKEGNGYEIIGSLTQTTKSYLKTADGDYIVTADGDRLYIPVVNPIGFFEACVGDQLDMLGEIIGQERRVYFEANPDLSPPTLAQWVELEDNDYRNLLKNKMMINTWDGKASTLQESWAQLYPGGIISIQDNQDMTVDITISGTFSDTVINLILNGYIIPRPQGVEYNIYYADLPIFGFDREDDYIDGFDIGYWV